MTAVFSTTYDDLYLFYLPIVSWSWNKIGCKSICFLPHSLPVETTETQKFALAEKYCQDISFYRFDAPDHKKATYAQCSRLYAAALDLPDDEVLVTTDIDMAVFNPAYFRQLTSGQIHVVGHDLVPAGQYPICYVAMPVKTWKQVMHITAGVPVQNYLDELLSALECDHFRGNYWGKDQETIYFNLTYGDFGAWTIVKHERAKHPHGFATRRADRDGWPDAALPDIIDAHLPRPGYTDDNFSKIYRLFEQMYPNEDIGWMQEYRNQYLHLL